MSKALVPPSGTVSQEERMFLVNWVANVNTTPSGVPFVTADFTAKQGRRVRVIDVRRSDELVGTLGYIPGSDWVPLERIGTLVDRVDHDAPIILISGGEERAHDAAEMLSKAGLRFVAFLVGGVMSWRDLGYSTTRDPSILDREDQIRDVTRVDAHHSTEALSAEHVRKHVGDGLSVKWIKLPALLVRGLVSCVDGRDDSGVIGSPGGDAGELLVGLRAIEKLTYRPLSDANVATILARRIDVFGRFYMHTDITSSNTAIAALRADTRFDAALRGVNEALEWRKFWASPPAELQPALIDYSLQAQHVGCGHLNLQLTHARDYDTREDLVRAVLRAFHEKRWEGAPEMEFVPLAGGHTERAVLNVRVGGRLLPFSRIPLVSPAVGGAQVFVHHPRVTSYLRKQLAQFLALQNDVIGAALDPDELLLEMERLGSHQLGKTLGAIAKGLPIFNVTFHGGQRVDVTAAGFVGG